MQPRVDQYFQQMDKIIKQKKTSSRVRFMLQDVAELRRNKWVPRREDNNPKTIDQIHREVQQEAVQRQQMLMSAPPMPNQGKRGGGGRGRGPGGPGHGGQGGEDGWTSVGASKTTRNTLDPSRMKLTKVPCNIKTSKIAGTL